MDNLKDALRASRGYGLILLICLVIALWPARAPQLVPHQTQGAPPHLTHPAAQREAQP